MESSKVNDWMQVIGIFALVASLIFVGLQMIQTQEIALESQYEPRAATVLEFHRTHMETGISRLTFEMKEPDELTPEEINYGFPMIMWSWFAHENHHFQYVSDF